MVTSFSKTIIFTGPFFLPLYTINFAGMAMPLKNCLLNIVRSLLRVKFKRETSAVLSELLIFTEEKT